MTQQLSPASMARTRAASRAVLDALFMDELNGPQQLMARAHVAAALRAVAEHCVPDDSEGHWVYIPHVLAIAAELEGFDD